MKINYDEVAQVEIIKEFAWGVLGLYTTELQDRNFNLEDTSLYEVRLYKELTDMLALNLFDKNLKELARIKNYWIAMDKLTSNIFESGTEV